MLWIESKFYRGRKRLLALRGDCTIVRSEEFIPEEKRAPLFASELVEQNQANE